MEKLYIDTHAHLTDKQFDEDRSHILTELQKSFSAVVEIGCDFKTSGSALKLAHENTLVYAALGIHPSEVKNARLSDLDFIKQNATAKKVVAIGEIGLDYYWDKDEDIKALQKRWFIMQLDIARQNNLPVVIHSREAAKDTLDIIKTYASDLNGIIHCYSYSYEQALEYTRLGYYLGIGGVVTYNNSKKLQEVVEKIPLEYLVLETDSPYLSPIPNRGKRNSSLNLPFIVEKIAELKNITSEAVLKQTYKNACKVYKIFKH